MYPNHHNNVNPARIVTTHDEEDEIDHQVNEIVAVGRIESKSNDSPMRVGKLEIVTESLEAADKWNNEKAVSASLLSWEPCLKYFLTFFVQL